MITRTLPTLAAILMLSGAAFAQTGTTSSTTTTTTTTITPQQETAIRTYVTKEKTRSVAAPSGFSITTGATLPQDVELHSFGSDVGVSQYRYVIMNDRTVLVDPTTRRVVRMVE